MLPCIKESSLGIFTTTADERFLLGEDVFFRTHSPVTMKRFRTGGQVINWTEEELLQELYDNENTLGNRTFVLYGAAGSGKSEMIRWIESRVAKTNRRPFMLRISRTELDPLKIMHKLLSKFKGINLDDTVFHRWEDLRKKPVTLANHLVWSALGKMLPSDNEIIPISYQLRPIIENNLGLNFSGIDNYKDLEGRTPELISLEELEELTRQCALPLNIDCQQLRFLMAKELEQTVLGGYNFVDTIKDIGNELFAKTGVRPMLLIDDLVQSMNIYSTDLLDYFITLEEGNWDIVLGLTPASFETNKRGREILGRITNLDTFDDRLVKLWLTDEQGNDSYFINSDNCHLFAEKYILESKRSAGFNCCGECALIQNCTALQMGLSNTANLSPFNQAFLRRIYRALPSNKGKARYFIKAIGEIMKNMAKGDAITALENFIEREISVDHPEPMVRLVGEVYAPETVRKEGQLKISAKALSIFIDDSNSDIEVNVSDLSSLKAYAVPERDTKSKDSHLEINTSKSAIRDWLEGRPVNKALLKGLRLGMAHICRELAQPCNLIPPNTARQSSVLKWDESIEGSKIPVALEGIDNFDGLQVSRRIGHVAYLLNYVHLKRGTAKEEVLAKILQSSEELLFITREAYKYRQSLVSKLNYQLGLPLEDFAYLLFKLLMELGQGGEEIPGQFYTEFQGRGKLYPSNMINAQVFLPEEYTKTIKSLFKDWFLIRENVYDAIKLTELHIKYRSADPILILSNIEPNNINLQYKIGNTELSKFISELQLIINELVKTVRDKDAIENRERLINKLKLLDDLNHPGMHSEVQALILSISNSLQQSPPAILEWQLCVKLKNKLKRLLKSYLDKNGKLILGSPIVAHRFLLSIAALENDKDFASYNNVCTFIEKALVRTQEAREDMQNTIENSSLAGHLVNRREWSNNIHTDLEGEWGVEYLATLSDICSEYRSRQRYLTYLLNAIPYVDHNLVNETKAINEVLEGLLTLTLPKQIVEKLDDINKRCKSYFQKVYRILNWERYEDNWRVNLDSFRECYKYILAGGVRQDLLAIGAFCQKYLENIEQLISVLNVSVNTSLIKSIIADFNKMQGLNNNINLVNNLYNCCVKLNDIPSVTQLNESNFKGKNKSHIWIMEKLLSPEQSEFTLTEVSLSELKNFIQNYPQLSHLIKAKLYLA